MTSRPPSSLSPSSKLDLDVVSSRMEAKAIPQQVRVMTQNHQATTHQWDAAGVVPTTTSASQPQGQARLTKFRRPNPLKFSGKSGHNHLSHMLNTSNLKREQLLHNSVRNNQRGIEIFSVMNHIFLERTQLRKYVSHAIKWDTLSEIAL